MRRLRRYHQRQIKKNSKLRKKAIAAGAAAAIAFGTGVNLSNALAAFSHDKHELIVNQDADADLLSSIEEIALGYRPFISDQNCNGVPDGIELAHRCAYIIDQLPWEEEVSNPDQTYKWSTPTFGLETCDVCGETVNMGPAGIVNPKLNLRVDCPLIALHYMEHGSFSYQGDTHKGRIDTSSLLRALEIRFPFEPNEHQLVLEENDLDGDLLTDNEELVVGFDLYNTDQNENLIPDGPELANQCLEVINELPLLDPNGPEIHALYKVDHLARGIEICDVCGESVNMGYQKLVNLKVDLSIDVPYIVCHYLEHGSFSYSGNVHNKGRIDVALLVKILEMPNRCGDLGTIYSPTDINHDCRVDSADLMEFLNQWLEYSDPNQGI